MMNNFYGQMGQLHNSLTQQSQNGLAQPMQNGHIGALPSDYYQRIYAMYPTTQPTIGSVSTNLPTKDLNVLLLCEDL